MHRRAVPSRLMLPLVLAPVLALGACASGASGSASSSTTAAATAATFSPVTLDDCGTQVTVTKPPTRVVSIKSSATEMMLALGLGDRLVGTAFADGPVPSQWAAAAAKVPVLGDTLPSQEALLAANPDFVYAGWESNVSSSGVGDRATLASRGIGTYVSPAACKEKGSMPDPLTFDTVFGEIGQVGQIFGVPDRAAALVAKQKADLAAVHKLAGHRTALWYSSGNDTPYVGAGIGAPQMIMDAAGLTNVFADVHDTWTSVGWEKVVAANPDVIVLVDATWNTAASKITALEQNPATAQLAAVKQHRYVVVPFAATEAGVRNVEAVQTVVAGVNALDGGPAPTGGATAAPSSTTSAG
ncbi:putative F420-0 ABC transporter substrate-binding protein [Cellulomonas sp. NTE-D12]|uniref:putative F420-0 ABC transporter substrate-binding protein n=1 Tax=Cellulomonas sp. NTE-D12 TaxID=2962632 RepID=UPI00308139B3|nr:ABC transporter substrate-binding protein [Cellulomonas sp. NTE-D12]